MRRHPQIQSLATRGWLGWQYQIQVSPYQGGCRVIGYEACLGDTRRPLQQRSRASRIAYEGVIILGGLLRPAAPWRVAGTDVDRLWWLAPSAAEELT
jgi:hypothetical protein